MKIFQRDIKGPRIYTEIFMAPEKFILNEIQYSYL